jgi:hypothetical protein
MRLVLFFLSASLLFGQLDNNSITITASRSIPTQPDQVMFNIALDTPVSATIDDAIAALPGLGLSASQLTGVSASGQGPLTWEFTLTVPLASLKDTMSTLTALQTSLAKNGPALTFGVGGTSSTPAQCAKSDLVADATAQAQKLTAAAGLTLGPILAVSNVSTANAAQGTSYAIATFSLIGALISNPLSSAPSATTCSLTVKFGMTRY